MGLLHVLAAGIRTNNQPLSGGRAYTYQSGSLTLQTVYQQSSVSLQPGQSLTAHLNPITLDSEGRAFAYSDVPVRVIVQDANGVQIEDFDPAVDAYSTTLDKIRNDSVTQASFTGVTAAWDVQQIVDSLNGRAISPITALDAKVLVTQAGAVGRKVRAIASDILNVKNFGAVGDGTTDDGPAIRLAITALGTGGGCLYFPATTASYSVQSSLLAFSNLTNILICGDGPGSVIKFTLSNAALIDLQSGTSNVTICDLTLQGAGTTSTTTAIGIQVSATSQDVRIHGCRITGPSAGTGFNVGVKIASGAKDVWVDGCKVTRIYKDAGNTVGYGVYSTGGIRTTVTNSHFLGDDSGSNQMSIGIFGNTADRMVSTGNTIENCLDAGIYYATCAGSGSVIANNAVRNTSGGSALAATSSINLNTCTYNTVTGNVCIGGGNSAHGILVQTSTRCKIADNICQGNTNDGINVYQTSTRLSLSGNLCTGNTRYGISYTSSTDSADPHNGGIVASNICERNLQQGFYFQGASYILVTGNQSNENSVGSNGSYPGFDVTTANPSGTHRGGTRMVFTGNSAREKVGDGQMLAALRIQDSAGTNNNVSTTHIRDNDFPLLNNGITSCLLANASGALQAVAGGYQASIETGQIIPSTGTMVLVAASTTLVLSAQNTGTVYVCQTNGGAITIDMPDFRAPASSGIGADVRQAWWVRLIRADSAAVNNLNVRRSQNGGATDKILPPSGGGATVTSISTAVPGASIDLIYIGAAGGNGVFFCYAHTPAVANSAWTTP